VRAHCSSPPPHYLAPSSRSRTRPKARTLWGTGRASPSKCPARVDTPAKADGMRACHRLIVGISIAVASRRFRRATCAPRPHHANANTAARAGFENCLPQCAAQTGSLALCSPYRVTLANEARANSAALRERPCPQRRLAWERLWRILLAPPTEVEQARLQRLRNRQRQDDHHDEEQNHGN